MFLHFSRCLSERQERSAHNQHIGNKLERCSAAFQAEIDFFIKVTSVLKKLETFISPHAESKQLLFPVLVFIASLVISVYVQLATDRRGC